MPTLGVEVAIKIDQTLTQTATATLVMLELEAMGLDRVKTGVSVQCVADPEERQRLPVVDCSPNDAAPAETGAD
jgi:hypothetical protein